MSATELGIIFALGTAFSWAMAGVIHTAAARMVGIQALMLVRQPLAAFVLGGLGLAFGLLWLPPSKLLLLAGLSGLAGIIAGDACFYKGALTIGLRPAQVCQSLSACFTALLGAAFLNEQIGTQGWAGIFIATCGVILVVVSEQHDAHNAHVDTTVRNRGLLFSLSSAVLIALGMIFSKQALEEGLGAFPLTFYRNAICAVAIWFFVLMRGTAMASITRLRSQPKVHRLLLAGCVFGPSGGIWLSCAALEYLPASLAAMLIGLEPIAMLIILSMVEHRPPAAGSILGAATACTGAAIVFMR